MDCEKIRAAWRDGNFGADGRTLFSGQFAISGRGPRGGYQIIEAKSYGADAVLLIAAMLDPALMRDLREHAASLSLDALVEVHTESELESAVAAGAQVIGINNRDLNTFKVSLSTTEQLASRVPPGAVLVCESGIDSLDAIRRVEKLGVHVFLIGESLMRAADPGVKLSELLLG